MPSNDFSNTFFNKSLSYKEVQYILTMLLLKYLIQQILRSKHRHWP